MIYDMNKTKWIWIYDCQKRQYSAIKDHEMPFKAIKKAIQRQKGHTRPHKGIQGHIRPYKANTAIHYHNVPQKHIFCSIWSIFHSCFHAKKKKNNKNNNKASFRTFERCSRSKSVQSKAILLTEMLYSKALSKAKKLEGYLFRIRTWCKGTVRCLTKVHKNRFLFYNLLLLTQLPVDFWVRIL